MNPIIEQKAHELHRLIDQENQLQEQLKSISENIDMLNEEFVKYMKENGIIKSHIEGVGSITFKSNLWTNILKSDREIVFEYFRGIGEGGLIKKRDDYIHHKTLTAYIQNLINEGKQTPDKINYGFKEFVEIDGMKRKPRKKKVEDEGGDD